MVPESGIQTGHYLIGIKCGQGNLPDQQPTQVENLPSCNPCAKPETEWSHGLHITLENVSKQINNYVREYKNLSVAVSTVPKVNWYML